MATIKQVAEEAKVSPSTVSRVFSGKAYVARDIKEKVYEAAEKLDYTPNPLAKALKEGKSNTIGLVVPDIQNPIFPIITKGIENSARKNGFTVVLCNTDNNIDTEVYYINKLKDHWIDGFILCTATPGSKHLVELRKSGIPIVLVSRSVGDRIDSVVVDNYKATYNAVTYLINTGHKRIAMACGPRSIDIYEQRFRGYFDALKDHGITFSQDAVIYIQDNNFSFYPMTRYLIRDYNPDAIVATSDPVALIVMRAIHDHGLSIPDDISVIGFDNIEQSQYVEPPLTTISQPLYNMGEIATQKLITMIKNPPLKDPIIDILPTELIIRKSTR
jgi:LacI family transcriptional regulator